MVTLGVKFDVINCIINLVPKMFKQHVGYVSILAAISLASFAALGWMVNRFIGRVTSRKAF